MRRFVHICNTIGKIVCEGVVRKLLRVKLCAGGWGFPSCGDNMDSKQEVAPATTTGGEILREAIRKARTPPSGGDTLREAVRRARQVQAERTDHLVDMRAAEVTHLELLGDQLKPLIADLPSDCDLFDFALGQSSPPRYWIDMVAFVMMSRDRKSYRLYRDTRAGRELLRESVDPDDIAVAVRDYVAHRLVERERALASGIILAEPTKPQPRPEPEVAPAPAPRKRTGSRIFAFLLGVVAGVAGIVSYAYYVLPASIVVN